MKSGGTDDARHTNQTATLAVSEPEAADTAVAHVKLAVITATRAHSGPARARIRKQPLSKGSALTPRLASLRRLALRARTAHSRATAHNFKILEATFSSYFLHFRKVQLICHLLGLFPREVIKFG